MAEQTAMQKLIINLESIGITIPQGVKMVYLKIEKEQIINAHMYSSGNSSIVEAEYLAEQYYNEVYGGQGSPDTSPNIKNK